jgi:hypothetical protein
MRLNEHLRQHLPILIDLKSIAVENSDILRHLFDHLHLPSRLVRQPNIVRRNHRYVFSARQSQGFIQARTNTNVSVVRNE